MRGRGRAGLVLAAMVCAVVSVTAIAQAQPATPPAPAARPVPRPALRTPLWSSRRVPTLLQAAADAAARDRARVELTRRLDAVVAPVDACVAVDAADGTPVARVGADRALAPASTMKLLTATAAIARLGPDHRFTTRVLATGRGGDLVVVGGGDPLLATPEYAAGLHAQSRFRNAPFTPLGALADAIVASGVRDVPGALVVDDHLHDTVRFLPGWKPIYAREGDIGALGALTVDGGFADPATATPAADPAVTAGQRLAAMLATRGVRIAGGVRRGTAPAGAHVLAHVESARLADVVAEMLTSSDNYTAEELLRDLSSGAGHVPATSAQGVALVAQELDRLGVPHPALVMRDGSGLAPSDRVTCATMLRLIELATTPRFVAIRDGLAVAARSGTLAQRFAGGALAGRLRAKTGSISGVVGLVGIIDGGDGLRFAFLANGGFSAPAGEQLQADVASAVGAAPALQAPRGLVPPP